MVNTSRYSESPELLPGRRRLARPAAASLLQAPPPSVRPSLVVGAPAATFCWWMASDDDLASRGEKMMIASKSYGRDDMMITGNESIHDGR
jgi:hypothetical protein